MCINYKWPYVKQCTCKHLRDYLSRVNHSTPPPSLWTQTNSVSPLPSPRASRVSFSSHSRLRASAGQREDVLCVVQLLWTVHWKGNNHSVSIAYVNSQGSVTMNCVSHTSFKCTHSQGIALYRMHRNTCIHTHTHTHTHSAIHMYKHMLPFLVHFYIPFFCIRHCYLSDSCCILVFAGLQDYTSLSSHRSGANHTPVGQAAMMNLTMTQTWTHTLKWWVK